MNEILRSFEKSRRSASTHIGHGIANVRKAERCVYDRFPKSILTNLNKAVDRLSRFLTICHGETETISDARWEFIQERALQGESLSLEVSVFRNKVEGGLLFSGKLKDGQGVEGAEALVRECWDLFCKATEFYSEFYDAEAADNACFEGNKPVPEHMKVLEPYLLEDRATWYEKLA